MATETLKEDEDIPYKPSTDIQVAGMLIYFILSGGHHPFGGERYKLMSNIQEGKYKLDHIQDVVAKDLIERMIDKEPQNRPRVEECLSHPYFWTSTNKVQYLSHVGNMKEVASRQNVNQELISMLDECAEGVFYNQWKTEFSPDLVQRMDDKKKPYPQNILGLLRFMRNLQVHYADDAASVDLISLFPHLFGCVYKCAIRKGWNLENPLKEMFKPEETVGANRHEVEPKNYEEHVGLAVQESEHTFTEPTANAKSSISRI
ncbi:sensor for unfolded proteins in the ER ire1 isoform X3 [Hippoglossus stenolepis]|nr:sensor for unfolded proteins in the ER ire1 isoform X3 [Hippoglossus stenolepis]XP_047194810.1 sensor for unfolded proteins in the ER ire1 isoform X3 [Hippoglossus stenolepis]